MSLRYSLAFLLSGLLLGAWAIRAADTNPWGLCLLYPAFSLIVVGAAYGGIGPSIYGKRSNGRRSWLGIICLAPFGLLSELGWRLSVWFSREPAIGPAALHLHFGRRLTMADRSQADAFQFRGCLDLTAEFTEVPFLRQLPEYRVLPILDGTAPSNEQLTDAVGWLTTVTANGTVYVHCALGHGRTGTVLVAYLLANRLENTIDAALHRLRMVRPGLDLNLQQRQQLVRFQQTLSKG